MKKSIIVSLAVIALMFASCSNSSNKTDSTKSETLSQNFNLDTTQLKSGETFYQCEMHAEVISEKAGKCPKCGMGLSEMKKQ